MSDLIARIAARAAGTPPMARPRPPAFSGGDAPSLEIVDERVVAAAARVEAPRPESRAAAVPQVVPDVELPPTGRTPERVDAVAPAPSSPRETVLAVERTMGERGIAAPVPAPPPPRTPDGIVRAEPVPAVQATPVVLSAAVQAAAAPTAVARVDESPPVRVHIGRLEVRANLQHPPQQQPRREVPRAQGLNLADYLRGKREAG